MRKNKKGQFFAIYLVLLTLFMCGMAIWIYYMQNKTVNNSLASPVSILELKDKQELFDLQEINIIAVSAKESELAKNKDLGAFKGKFFDYLMMPEQEQFRNFIFSNLTLDGKFITAATIASDEAKKSILGGGYGAASGNALEIYHFSIEGDKLKVERKHLGKYFLIKSPDRSVTNFIVFVDYNYDKSYLIPFDEMKADEIEQEIAKPDSDVSVPIIKADERSIYDLIPFAGMAYNEGLDDSFLFRWNSATGKAEVKMYLNFDSWGGGVSYGWTSDVSNVKGFSDLGKVYDYEKQDILDILNAGSWKDANIKMESIEKMRIGKAGYSTSTTEAIPTMAVRG